MLRVLMRGFRCIMAVLPSCHFVAPGVHRGGLRSEPFLADIGEYS